MLNSLRVDVTEKLSRIRPLTPEEQAQMLSQMRGQQEALQGDNASNILPEPDTTPTPAPATPLPGFDEADPATWGNPGRNTPCPCGSGKKFKHCHGHPTHRAPRPAPSELRQG